MFTSTLSRLVLICLALSPLAALADDLFSGCYSKVPNAFVTKANTASSSACTTICGTGTTTYTHSYYNASSSQCICSNGTPDNVYLTVGNINSCGLNYDNRNVFTSFMSLQPACYATLPVGAGAVTPQNGVNGCLLKCANSLRATFWKDPNTLKYSCACSVPTSYGAEAVCGPDSYFGFYHTPAAAASGLTRRKRLEAKAVKKAEMAAQQYCPKGLTACLVKGAGSEQYECIHTPSELESCGGCIVGQYDVRNGRKGEDCSMMEGVARGGSTCLMGTCRAYACRRGYSLLNGICRRISHTPGKRKSTGGL